MSTWHWYDTVIFIACWSLIPACLIAQTIEESRWLKKYGEREEPTK